MKPRLINLEATTKALKPYIKEYLSEHGIDTSKNFKCINPKHTDSDPSMMLHKEGRTIFCWGCGFSGDIFTAANIFEKKPISGKGFLEDNVLYLAEKYGVEVKVDDLTQEEIYEYRTYAAYRCAASLIADPEFGDYSLANEEIERRRWNKEKLVEWGIGTVDFSEYRERMRRVGFEPGFLNAVDLDRSNLFNSNNLLFTVYDDEGRPVGFSAKNLKHKNGDKKSGPKYINTRGTGLECAIFKKGERLYGYEIAKDAPDPLYIFEGQADVITARHYGLMNCCCTMGTALTDHHITLLKKYGSFNVVLVFDSDPAGETAIEKALDDKFSKEKDFRVKLCQLMAGQDPDDLLRNNGFDEFVRLKRWTAFEWRMMQFIKTIDGEIDEEKRNEIAEKMIPIVVSEKSHLRQEGLAKQVAKVTGYDTSTIMSEIKRLRNEKEADTQARKKNLIESLLYDVRRNPNNAELALAQCQSALNNINKSMQTENESSATLNAVMSLKESDDARTGEFAGFFLKPDGLAGVGKHLDDDWKTDNLFFVGGSEQSGKTTFCSQMAFEIADDERNNAICIYHSIDDSMKRIIYKWICNASENLNLYQNHVSNPNYWAKQEGFEFIKKERSKAYKKVINMVKDNKLVVKDSADGASLSYIETVVDFYKETYPTKNIVLFIDNFHKLPDYSEINGHERVKRLSNHIKNMAVSKHITVVSTVEYRKLQPGEKPTNLAIAESRSLAYDGDIIIHLYNDLHHTPANQCVLVHENEQGELLPRIWCKFGKNKVSGFEGRIFLDLFPSAAHMCPVDTKQAEEDQLARLEFIKESRTKDMY